MKPGEVQTYLPPPPHSIVDYLNGHIIGHYVMKKALSVAIYNHFCKINFGLRYNMISCNFLVKPFCNEAIIFRENDFSREIKITQLKTFMIS